MKTEKMILKDINVKELFNLEGKVALISGGAQGLGLQFAEALAPFGINVNCISPGGFKRGQPEEFIKNYEYKVPLGRMGRDGLDLKGAIVFCASPASDYMVGHNLVIDGGMTIWS